MLTVVDCVLTLLFRHLVWDDHGSRWGFLLLVLFGGCFIPWVIFTLWYSDLCDLWLSRGVLCLSWDLDFWKQTWPLVQHGFSVVAVGWDRLLSREGVVSGYTKKVEGIQEQVSLSGVLESDWPPVQQ